MPIVMTLAALALLQSPRHWPGADLGRVAPGVCAVVGELEVRGDRAVGKLSLTYQVRTTLPRTLVPLGTQGAFVVAARTADGRLPPLRFGPEGLCYLAERPGEHRVTLDAEVRVAPRGLGGESGFAVGLPQAAITTLALKFPAPPGRVTVAPKVAGVATPTSEEPAALARPDSGYPLGPAESVEVTWATADRSTPLSAEVDVAVRVDETSVETVAKLRLRGAAGDWRFLFPAAADVVAERASGRPADGDAAAMPGLVRPTSAQKPEWVFRPPDVGGDWLLTATHRQARLDARAAVALGPVSVLGIARQTGVVRLTAPPVVRLAVKESVAELRQLDPEPVEDDTAQAYRYTLARPSGGPFLTLAVQSLPGFTRVRPQWTLRRTETGWQATADLRVTPVRQTVEELVVEVPPGYQGVEARGAAVEDVAATGGRVGNRRYAVRLAGPQRTPFDLTLTANYPSPPTTTDEGLELFRFPGSQVEAGRVTVTVLEGLEVGGTVTTTGNEAVPLTPEGPTPGPLRTVAAAVEQPAARLQVAWRPYRPELPAELTADIHLGERQAVVRQQVRVRPSEGDARPIRLRGPALGVRSVEGGGPLAPAGPGEWVARPQGAGGGEVVVAVVYALPLPGEQDDAMIVRAPLPLLWPDGATQVEATVRVWGAGSPRMATRAVGPWRELPPAVVPGQEALPWLTLAGSGATLPLTVELAPADPAALAPVVERALVQAWLTPQDALAVRARFALSRWSPAGAEVAFAGEQVPEFYLDGRRLDPAGVRDAGPGRRVARLPLPDCPPDTREVILDVRAVNPSGRAGPTGPVVVVPPEVVAATVRLPIRWRVGFPSGVAPWDAGGALTPDARWVFARGGWVPGASATPAESAGWLTGAATDEADDSPELALTARQATLAPVELYFLPRAAVTAGVSALMVALGLVLTRLGRVGLASGLTPLGAGVALAAVLRPQVAGQLMAAALPGVVTLALLGVALGGRSAWRARRVRHLPGFTRSRPDAGPATSGSATRDYPAAEVGSGATP